ncbi:periplasmic binding protein-like I [Obelidium mucronatum]|nr:periplasmic binding protein-like I [Obelidium mucronatum]
MLAMYLFLLVLLTYGSIMPVASPIVGLFPGTSSIRSKHESNLTIAFILPYVHFWEMKTAEEYATCGGDCGFFRQMDSAAEWVVNMINNRTDILPNTMVNILRVHEWGENGWTVGDIAPASMALAEHPSKPIAAFGTTSSTRGSLATGILSQYKIPHCAGSLNSPVLSNKHNYPYFFRPTYANKWGNDMANLFSGWKVKRIGMVFDSYDDESRLACLDIKAGLFAQGIAIVSYLHYHGHVQNINFTTIAQELAHADVRYIIVCAQGWSQSFNLILAANETGLISKNHVWTFTNVPYPPDVEGDSDSRLKLLNGIVFPFVDFQDHKSSNYISIDGSWNDLYKRDPLKYQDQWMNWATVGAYDCLGTLLYGLHKAMKNTKDENQIKSRLNFTAFMDSGFNGANLNPMQLNEFGDPSAATTFSTFNNENPALPPFVMCGKNNELQKLMDPVFFGGSSVPPWDGSEDVLPVVLATLADTRGKIILSLIVICYVIVLSLAVFVILYRNHPCVKTINPIHSIVSITGNVVLMTCSILLLELPSSQKCYTRIWLYFGGVDLLIAPLIMKNWYLLRIFCSTTSIRTQDLSKMFYISQLATISTLIIQISLLVAYTSQSNIQVTTIALNKAIVYRCIDRSLHFPKLFNSAQMLVTVWQGLLLISLLGMAIAVRNLNNKYNDSSFLLFVFVTLSLLSILEAQVGVDQDSPVKETIYLFIAATHVPVLLVGPKIVEVYSTLDYNSFSFPRGSSSKKTTGRYSSSLHQQHSTTLEHTKISHAEFLCSNVFFCCRYKKLAFVFKMAKSTFGIWRQSSGILVSCIKQRQWLTIHSSDGVFLVCLPLDKDTMGILETGTGNMVIVPNPNQLHWVELEFENKEKALDFKEKLRVLCIQ